MHLHQHGSHSTAWLGSEGLDISLGTISDPDGALARLYERLSKINPSLPRYQESAARFGREIPLVILTPL